MEALTVPQFLNLARQDGLPIIDARSPSEYLHAHIPTALSYPLFNDQERAQVGTVYKQEGREQAVLRGLSLVEGRLRSMGEFALQHALTRNGQKTILLHCWRGGMRSSSMAWLFQQVGVKSYLLQGGYKAYRNHVLDILQKPLRLKVLGGKTGSGKTEILQELKKRGEQILDLEALASHKGSVFGYLGMPTQPGQEQFENNLAKSLQNLDLSRPIWIEDESRMIGRLSLPPNIWQTKLASPLYFVEVPMQTRIEHLLQTYGKFPPQQLSAALAKIEKRLGGQRSKEAQAALAQGDIAQTAQLALYYYDKAYLYATQKRQGKNLYTLEFCGFAATAQKLRELI